MFDPSSLSENAQRAGAMIEQHASALEKQHLFPHTWNAFPDSRWWFDGDRGFALLIPPRTDLPPPVKLPILGFTAPDHRRSGVFRGLLRHMQRDLQAEGHDDSLFSILTNSLLPDGPACCTALGFTKDTERLRLDGETYVTPEHDRIEDVTFRFYNGGDAEMDTRVFEFEAMLYQREMASMITLPKPDPERFSDENRFLILAANDAGDLVGEVECLFDPPFATRLGVTRQYWGTGLADELCHRTMNMLVSRNIQTVSTMSRATNAASVRMLKRVGLKESCRLTEWVRPFFDTS